MKRTLKNVWSPQRRDRRDVDVYLPPSYRSGGSRRYPVVYMQDGQNLSDPATAFAGTWDLESTLERLAARGLEIIVVGVHHGGEERLNEFSPFPDRRYGGGAGESYLSFLV
jgi:predicted alpha/beta superfamily hydrolase